MGAAVYAQGSHVIISNAAFSNVTSSSTASATNTGIVFVETYAETPYAPAATLLAVDSRFQSVSAAAFITKTSKGSTRGFVVQSNMNVSYIQMAVNDTTGTTVDENTINITCSNGEQLEWDKPRHVATCEACKTTLTGTYFNPTAGKLLPGTGFQPHDNCSLCPPDNCICTLTSATPRRGFSLHYENRTTNYTTVRCPNADGCPGQAANTCARGYSRTDLGCSVCDWDNDFNMGSDPFQCDQCPTSRLGSFLLMFTLRFISVALNVKAAQSAGEPTNSTLILTLTLTRILTLQAASKALTLRPS